VVANTENHLVKSDEKSCGARGLQSWFY